MHTKTSFIMFVCTEIIVIIDIMFDLHSVQVGLLSFVFLDFTIHESFTLHSFIEMSTNKPSDCLKYIYIYTKIQPLI